VKNVRTRSYTDFTLIDYTSNSVVAKFERRDIKTFPREICRRFFFCRKSEEQRTDEKRRKETVVLYSTVFVKAPFCQNSEEISCRSRLRIKNISPCRCEVGSISVTTRDFCEER